MRVTETHAVKVASQSNIELRNWISKQLDFEQRGTLLPERRAKLDAIGFVCKHELDMNLKQVVSKRNHRVTDSSSIAPKGQKRKSTNMRLGPCWEDSEDDEVSRSPRKRFKRLKSSKHVFSENSRENIL